MTPTLVLLPGLHGTADLFGPLIGVIPPQHRTRIVTYPTDRALDYAACVDHVAAQMEGERDIVLIAESFSTAIALHLAARDSSHIRAVILCVGFVTTPVPRLLSYLATPFVLVNFPIPAFAVRYFLAGRGASRELLRQTRAAICSNKNRVLAHRVRLTASCNAKESLRNCKPPILYLAGDRDRLVGRRALRRILRVRRDITHQTLAGPHLLLQRSPAEAWRAIESFLATQSIIQNPAVPPAGV
jgi:pimeloyl-ACP methyl ester carboxylesterase